MRRFYRVAIWILQFARCGSDRCSPDPSEHFPLEPPSHLRPRESRAPASVSFRIPASVAAEAGSQPMPHCPMMALASAISCSLTFSTTPLVTVTSCERFRPGHRIADVDGRGQCVRIGHALKLAARLHELDRTARRLRPGSPPAVGACG